jgi:hypothetical protein
MRLFKLNIIVLALIFSLFIEGVSTGVGYWLASFSPDTFEDTLYDLILLVHMPALKLMQMFYPTNHWPGVGAHILFYIFSVCEFWILSFAVVWIFRHFYRRSDDESRSA